MNADTFIVAVAIALRIGWLFGELRQRRRFPHASNQQFDKHSAAFWDIANLIEPIGFFVAVLGVGRLSPPLVVQSFGLVLLLSGIVLRFSAINTLGRFFTSVVTVREDHRIVSSGPYKFVRHPGYAGALLAHAGLGLAFGSWVSTSMSVLPFIIAAAYRIKVEEKALLKSMGEDYATYSSTTSRLIPKVF